MSAPASTATNPPAPPMTLREVFALPVMRRLWLAQIISVFGDFLALFAAISIVSFKFNASAREVTLVTFAVMLPFAFVGPVAGVFVDRWDVKRTMIISDLIRAVLAILLVLASTTTHYYVILLLIGVVSSFFVPAQTTTVRTVIPPNGLIAANGLMQQAVQLTRIASPALAGIMVEHFGPAVCYYVDSLSFLVSAALLMPLVIKRTPTKPAPGSHPVKSVLHDLAEGIKFLFTHELLAFVVVAMSAAMFAISCFGPLIAVYVRDDLHANSTAFGVINSLLGIGMVVGTIGLQRLMHSEKKNLLIVAGLFTMGLFVSVLALWHSLWGAALGMFGIGLGVVLIFVSAQALMQGRTPMELLGRVSGSVMASLSLAQLAGLIFSGALAHWLSIPRLFLLTAVLLVLFAGFGYWRIPQTSETPAQAAPVA